MEPQSVICFHCQKPFEISYNKGIGMPSQKNYWNYWVDENWDYKQMRRIPDSERGAKICNSSLRLIWKNKDWQFIDQIKSKVRRQTLASYIYHKII